jgi:hypothetical protein
MSENFHDDSFYLPVSSSSSNDVTNENKTVNGDGDVSGGSSDQMDTLETFEYTTISYKWFYTVPLADNKFNWIALSEKDSTRLEDVYTQKM